MTHEQAEQAAAGRKPRSMRRRVIAVVLLVLIAGLTIAVAVGYWLWEQVPPYWEAQQRYRSATTPAERDRMARALENRVPDELTAVNPDDDDDDASPSTTRTIRIRFEEVNNWLDQRFDDWLANQDVDMPAGVEQPMVTSADGDVVFAFRVNTQELDQVISIVWNVRVREDGKAQLLVRGVRSGRLPLPNDAVLDRVMRYAQQQAGDEYPDAVAKLRALLEGEPFEPRHQLDAREARLLAFNVDREGVELVLDVSQPRAVERERESEPEG